MLEVPVLADRPGVQGHSQLPSKSEASLATENLVFKRKF